MTEKDFFEKTIYSDDILDPPNSIDLSNPEGCDDDTCLTDVHTEKCCANPPVDMFDVSEVGEGVKVQLITGLSTIYAIPAGGLAGQVLKKKSNASQDVFWDNVQSAESATLTTIALQFNQINGKYVANVQNNFLIVGVFNNNNQPILYDTNITKTHTEIIVDSIFEGYVVAYAI